MEEQQIDQDNMEQDVQEEVVASETPVEELPKDAAERTKLQFEKLKQHNKELAEEIEALKTSHPKQPSALESLYPEMVQNVAPDLSNQQVEDIAKGLVDENGYLDQALLENTLRQNNQAVVAANARAAQAESKAQQALNEVNKYGQDREVRIAHKKFPNVDPESSKYDPNFFKLVKNALLGSMYEGRKLSFVDACREVSTVYTPKKEVKTTKAEAVEEYKKTVATKSNLNPTGTSRPESSITNSDLIEGTRRGDNASIYARLANI